MLFIIGVGGMLTLVYAVWMLFDRDGSWERYEARMRFRGITNMERTPEWEASQTLSSLVGIIMGLMLMGFCVLVAVDSIQREEQAHHELQNQSQVWIDGKKLSPDKACRLGFGPC